MDDTKKMLQAIIHGQNSLKQELVTKIDKLDSKIDQVEKRLTNRINALGKQLAYLEDDAPTREEFDSLEERVGKIEQSKVAGLT